MRHVGFEETGSDVDHPHTLGTHLTRRGLGQAEQCGLRGAVVHLSGHGDEPGSGADINHHAATLPGHDPDRGLGGMEHSIQIYLDDIVPFLRRHHGEIVVARDPGVIDQNVDAAKSFQHRAHHRLDLGRICDIGLQRDGGAPDGGNLGADRFGEIRVVLVVDDDRRAHARQGQRRRVAEPARRSCNDRHLAG